VRRARDREHLRVRSDLENRWTYACETPAVVGY
jgi:hypothetical protein